MAEKISVRKTRRLRALLAKHYSLPEPADPKETTLDQVVMAVLWLDAPPARARLGFVNLAEEFADWNELRVSVTRDVAATLESCGLPSSKGAVLKRILGRAVEDFYTFDFDQLRERPREQQKSWFLGIEGVPHSVAAAILYNIYHYDRVLVDEDIARVIRRLGLVKEAATDQEIEDALAEVAPAKEAHFIYSALRQHALTLCTRNDPKCAECPLTKECVAGKARLAEIAAAAKAAEAAAEEKKAQEKAELDAKAGKKPAPKKASKAAKKPAAKPKASKKASTRRTGVASARSKAPRRNPGER